VRSLKLKNTRDWRAYCKSEKKPDDIPSNPGTVYADAGWVSWPDWLGNDWRSFEDARAFVRSLKLKSQKGWQSYCRSGKKPDDIPSEPNTVYAASWVSLRDWLGAGRRVGGWRSFEDARAFARRLKLKSGVEWRSYCRSGKKPDDIPTKPNTVYAASWVSLRDWLGAGRRVGGLRSFEDARAFARRLKLKSQGDWYAYCKSRKKPDDIPSRPSKTYAGAGWMNWPDWLGYERRHKLRKKLALTKSASRRRPSS
jgi:hypothetical protein